MSANRDARPLRMAGRPRRIARGSRFSPARERRVAMRPERVIPNLSRPFDRRGCSSVIQYATPCLIVVAGIAHEFQVPGCGAVTTQRPSRVDGRPARLP